MVYVVSSNELILVYGLEISIFYLSLWKQYIYIYTFVAFNIYIYWKPQKFEMCVD